MARQSIDRYIYSITKKPKHYVEVKNPPKTRKEKLARPQDARQLQYNRWSKARQIYSGSYLPYQSKELSRQGWRTFNKSHNAYETEHIRKSTGPHVLRHGRHVNRKGILEPTHYHWKNLMTKGLSKKKRASIYYHDKYGNTCARNSDESHIKPFKTRRKKT